MTDSRVEDVLRLHEQMKGQRGTWEAHWQEVAERVLPRMSDFTSKKTEGVKRTEKVFDGTPGLALNRFAAAMESILTPRTQTWHKLKPSDQALKKNTEVVLYLSEVNRRLFGARYSPKANFASQQSEVYISLGSFGTGALYIDEVMGYHLRYKSIHLAELFIMENAAGAIDRVHREFEYTARQAVQRYGEEALPEAVRKAAKNEPTKKFPFVHCVAPREELNYGRKDYRGMAYAAAHICLEGRALVKEGGYRTFPYAVSRYVTAPNEIYGRSPAMDALPDIKTLNEMEKTLLRVGQKIADPPMLLGDDDGGLQAFAMQPGALNYGAISGSGQQLAVPLQIGANLPITLEMQDGKRKAVDSHFLVNLFQILVDTPQMTATEAMLRAQEKGMLLAPTAGRQQSEALGPMIERELDLLAMAGQLPEMPDALREAGMSYDIEYDSPISRAQRAEEGIGIVRTIEALTPLAQVDPNVMKIINSERSARILAEVNGAPPEALNSPEEMDAIKEADAQQQQMAGLVQAAPAVSSAAANMAKLQQTTGAAGPLPA